MALGIADKRKSDREREAEAAAAQALMEMEAMAAVNDRTGRDKLAAMREAWERLMESAAQKKKGK